MSQNRAFLEREITPRDVLNMGHWRVKVYEIRVGTSARHAIRADGEAFADGMRLALEWLGTDAKTPGLAWLIRHVGAGANYVVVASWGNLNELFVRTFAAPADESAAPRWRPGGDEFSYCVWDMRVLWHERNAYVRHMLDKSDPSPEAYLADRCSFVPPEAPAEP